ncbi:MAG: hypothetical protein K2N49_05715, partial [Ruminococcus sp.]|nr:hypothetical protein [Ruminococcus sp.]
YIHHNTTDISAGTKSASVHAVTTARRTGSGSLVTRTGIYSTMAVRTAVPDKNVVPAPNQNVVTNVPAVQVPQTTTSARTSSTTNSTTTKTTESTYTTTTANITTTTAPVTTEQGDNPAIVSNDDFTCCVVENGVEIIRENIVIQTIEIDTSAMLNAYAEGKTEPQTRIIINDFDFDGNPDIFIPQEITEINTSGVFRRYKPETGTFEEWEEISDITGYAETDEENHTLIFTVTKNDYEYDTKIYGWNEDGKLVPISRKKQFRINDSESELWNVYVDYYEYPDGEETIIRREILIFNDVYEVVGSQEIGIEWILR